jgi:7-cyano-7-deazaguanine synthase
LKAVILLSGGLDSATVLAIASQQSCDCYAMSFAYGQRSLVELDAAKSLAKKFKVKDHKIISIDLAQLGGSALTDTTIAIPEQEQQGVPVTYVPARNTIFLSFALAYAEVLNAQDIFIGVNAVDYSGYPDCRSEYIASFQQTARLATKIGVEGREIKIHTPLIDLGKAEIIQRGLELDVDYSQTVSCYQANDSGEACGVCDSCRLRKEGFVAADVSDPTRYQ